MTTLHEQQHDERAEQEPTAAPTPATPRRDTCLPPFSTAHPLDPEHSGWTIKRVEVARGFQTIELFVSPDGVEYERCGVEHADLYWQSERPGLPVLALRRRDWRAKNLRRGI